jgi:serine/threonine protein kinase
LASRRQFRFIKEIARGGFGTVYMAEMVTGDNFSTVVAIKLLHAEWADHEEILMRSRDEARLLGRLRHRSIVRVEDLTYIQGHCAVIMEYLEGVDLKSLMGYLGGIGEPFPMRMAFEVTAHVASAMDSAYNYVPLQGGEPLQLIHRDIKPSNVMVTVEGDVKLLDFGTARANFDSREAHTESLSFGSQAYMAPERFMGDPDAPAGDIFSLGISLYELLAGQNIGRILLREDRFFENLDSRLAALPMDSVPEGARQDVRKVMRLMMDYNAENRPTAGQVVDLMEILAEKCEDPGMRRFSRDHIRPALQANPHQPGEDSLQGNTMVEDRSSTFETAGFTAPEVSKPVEDPEQKPGHRFGFVAPDVSAPVGEMPADAPYEEGDDETLRDNLDSAPEPVEEAFSEEVSFAAEDISEDGGELSPPEEIASEFADSIPVGDDDAYGGSEEPEPPQEEFEPEPVFVPQSISGPSTNNAPPLPTKPVSSGGSTKVLMIGVAVLLVIGAGVFALKGGGETGAPEDVPVKTAKPEPVVVEIPNNPPTADAGSDRSILLGQSVSLTGSGTDEDLDDTLEYSWSLESSPGGSSVNISAETGETVNFRPDKVGTYKVLFRVTDETDSASDQVTVTVAAPPPPGDIRISFFPIGGAEATLTGPGGYRYACPKNPHCMKLEASGLRPGNYSITFTARGKSAVKRTVNVRSSKQCIYNVESDTSVVNTKCQ